MEAGSTSADKNAYLEISFDAQTGQGPGGGSFWTDQTLANCTGDNPQGVATTGDVEWAEQQSKVVIDPDAAGPAVPAVAVGKPETGAQCPPGIGGGVDSDGDSVIDDGCILPVAQHYDTDNDGCSNTHELRDGVGSPTNGGLRDASNHWDFFDTPTGTALLKDGAVSAGDIAAIVGRFGANDATPPTGNLPVFDRNSNPVLTKPNPVTGHNRDDYHPAYDRGGTLVGSNAWNLKPPGGSIDAGDIAANMVQFGHNCV